MSETVPHYDIEADWFINDVCNYSCDYCFACRPYRRLFRRISADQYLGVFDMTGKKWLLHFTGGEPLLYPNFAEFCHVLSTSHFVSLNSNLSSEEVLKFSNTVDPRRVEYIHCAVHPKERERHEGYTVLLTRIQALLEKGFSLFASIVMTPDMFDGFDRILERFAAIDVPLIPKAIRGSYQGRHFPEGYTARQREQFMEHAKTAEDICRTSRWRPLRNSPTINPLLDQFFLDGFPDFRGKTCRAGTDFVTIKPEGNVYRCGRNTNIGDLFQGKLTLLSMPTPCNDSACPYICMRYSGVPIAQARQLPKLKW